MSCKNDLDRLTSSIEVIKKYKYILEEDRKDIAWEDLLEVLQQEKYDLEKKFSRTLSGLSYSLSSNLELLEGYSEWNQSCAGVEIESVSWGFLKQIIDKRLREDNE